MRSNISEVEQEGAATTENALGHMFVPRKRTHSLN